MTRTDDPAKDAETYEQEKMRMSREEIPECDVCGLRIEDGYYYQFDNWIVCQECLNEHKKWLW